MRPEKTSATLRYYALAFGLFLGLCIWKFGNPVILDTKIIPPESFSDFWYDPWPTHWANWILLALVSIGVVFVFKNPVRWPASNWLWLLPLAWLGWELISASQSVDADLTKTTLWQLFGCVGCYFLGALLFANPRSSNLLLVGILAAFTFCLIRAVDQRLVEFPQTRQALIQGQQENWTNVAPADLLGMKQEGLIITTNGVDIPNPVWMDKFTKERVMGTLVYPNALAGIVLILFPLYLTLAFGMKNVRPVIKSTVIGLAIFLGTAGMIWSGSKLGWLLAMGVGGLYLLRLDWPAKLKVASLAAIVFIGLGIFAIRFHQYFAHGATSVGARFDYWHAAIQTTADEPLFGTGPGTFQRPYARIKSPDAEMARLTHNDYLEQFSDSGIGGGVLYAAWIILALAALGKRVWNSSSPTGFAIFAGLLAWFIQGFGEFSLYIPGLAWMVFTLLGLSLMSANPLDKSPASPENHRGNENSLPKRPKLKSPRPT